MFFFVKHQPHFKRFICFGALTILIMLICRSHTTKTTRTEFTSSSSTFSSFSFSRSSKFSLLDSIQKHFKTEKTQFHTTTEFDLHNHQMPSDIESAKKKAACAAIDENIKSDGMVIGIGSGSTVVYAAEHLGKLVKENGWNKVRCVPTSFQSTQLIHEKKLTLTDLNQDPEIDIDIDGADEVDPQFQVIKGGGGCLLQEKVIAANSKRFIVVADHRKDSEALGTKFERVPIEVVPMAYVAVMKRIQELIPGSDARLRMAERKAGPVVTDNSNFIIDVKTGAIKDPATMEEKLVRIPGVVDVGLFINMVDAVYLGQEDGTVETKTKTSSS
eukprot:gb/GECH01014186.1/.p1 GENE.gb/GECH01014186.1/~~gb/GECH01014186.1/.p1  ORF type:complete len:329 (+),score=77.18 gb/GECH01014186.1/:1-987(+)